VAARGQVLRDPRDAMRDAGGVRQKRLGDDSDSHGDNIGVAMVRSNN
jgi:hypothetical protein